MCCCSHHICSISSLNPAKRTRCSILFEHTQVRAVRPTQLLGIRLDCAWTTLGSRPSDSSCHSRSAVAPVMVNPTRSLRWSTPASAHSAARRVQLLEHPCECTLRCKACPVQFCSVVVADLWLIHSCERTIHYKAWRCSGQPAVPGRHRDLHALEHPLRAYDPLQGMSTGRILAVIAISPPPARRSVKQMA